MRFLIKKVIEVSQIQKDKSQLSYISNMNKKAYPSILDHVECYKHNKFYECFHNLSIVIVISLTLFFIFS